MTSRKSIVSYAGQISPFCRSMLCVVAIIGLLVLFNRSWSAAPQATADSNRHEKSFSKSLPRWSIPPYEGLEVIFPNQVDQLQHSKLTWTPSEVSSWVKKIQAHLYEMREFSERHPRASKPYNGGPAQLKPAPTFEQIRRRFMLFAYMSRFSVLARMETWSTIESDLAKLMWSAISLIDREAPELLLTESSHKDVERVWIWFLGFIESRTNLAYCQNDPFYEAPGVGIEFGGDLGTEPSDHVNFGRELKIELFFSDSDYGNVIKLLRSGVELWCRAISYLDGTKMPKIKLQKNPVRPNGFLGWNIYLSMGEELVVSVHPEGNLLYYRYTW